MPHYSINELSRAEAMMVNIHHTAIAALTLWAKELFRRWEFPVYLCGSAFRKANPRDFDLRICLPHKIFEAWFGPVDNFLRESETGKWKRTKKRWSNFCVKVSREGRTLTGLPVDFMVQPARQFRRYSRSRSKHLRWNRLRLDRGINWPEMP